MINARNFREVRLKYKLQDTKALEALARIGVLTVDDLVTCPFGKLISEPDILRIWGTVTDIVLRVRSTVPQV